MIKRWSAGVVLVALLGQGVVYGQEPTTGHAPGEPTVERYPDPPEGMEFRNRDECVLARARNHTTIADWACAWVPVRRSPKLVVAGVASALVGGLLIGGGATYNVLGSDYCVGDYSVEAGSCLDPTVAKVGVAAIGAGAVMIVIGMQKVTVRPTITPTHKVVSATVRW